MRARFFDRQDPKNPLNGDYVDDERQLREIIRNSKHRVPFLAELVSDTGTTLLIGSGSNRGCAQLSPRDGRPPYLMAVGDPAAFEDEAVHFLIADTPTPIAKRYILSAAELERIAMEFVETGQVNATRAWEEV